MIDLSFIKERRTSKNMSVRDLAEATGINPSNLSRIENGSIIPKIDTLEKICKALDMQIKIK